MKRSLSILLTVAMLISMLTAFCVGSVTNTAAATVISNTTPAITVNVNSTINLTNYSVTFDDGTVSSNVTWKNGSSAITTFKPTSKGVTTLTATSGSKTKNIYVVAKNSTESEYVLYEANLANFASVDALKTAGWSFASGGNYSKASDGSLSLGVSDKWSIAYAYLPSWLGDFGNYGVEADVKVASVYDNDNTRWFSLLFHGAGRNGVNDNYWQMTVRNAANASNGVEFGERYNGSWTPSNGGTPISTAACSVALMSSAYNTIGFKTFNGYVSETIGNEQPIYVEPSATSGKLSHTPGKGQLGFTASGSTIQVKKVKVTLETAIPEEDIDTTLIKNKNHRGQNLVNPISNAQRVNPVNSATLSGLNVAFFNAADVNVTTAMKACVDAGVVPTIYVATNAQADSVVTAMNSTGNIDVTVVSNTASVLKYIRSKKAMVRTGLRMDISSYMADGILTTIEADAIRLAVRSAPATFCVVDSAYVTRDAVAELQELAVSVWATISNKSTGVKADFDVEVMKALTAGVNGVISDSASAIYDLIDTHFEANSFTRTSPVIGHRGNPNCAPENTIPSFQAAYVNGADIFEIDVDITKDNVVVVLHDGTLDRTTTYEDSVPDNPADMSTYGGTHINNMTWAEAQKYYVLDLEGNSTGEPIPTLEQVLNWAKGKDVKIFIEFKSAAATCVTQTMNKVKELNMTSQVDVISFASSALTQAQGVIPGISTGYLLSNTIDATTYLKALKQLENLIQYAQNVNSSVNIQSYGGQATRHSIQAATDRGMTVWPWTYNTSTTDKAFFSACDGITTDDVKIFKNMVKSVYNEKATMVVGQTYIGGTVTAETYGNERYLAEPESIVASVITGDAVEVKNGKLVAVKEGTAKVMFGYRTATPAGTEYIVYGQPVDITVDNGNKNSVKSLYELGNIADVDSYSEAELIVLRQLQQKALDIANGDATATDAEIIKLTEDIGNILNNYYELLPLQVASYTSPAPNYYKWNSATQSDSTELHPTYIDDGTRLTDGKKGSTSVDSSDYSAWSKGLNVELVLDYGKTISGKLFKGYFAAGQNGISAPTDMKIYYSDNKSSWTEAKGTLVKTQTLDGAWDLYEYTFVADTAVNARYIKFYIDPTGSFTWVDEVETVHQKGDYVQGDFVYLTGMNERVTEGQAIIYTSAANPITVADENHAWTHNIIAKYDKDLGEYVVKSSANGTGANTASITLASDEILIAVHDWESGVKDYTIVEGSAQNKKNAAAAVVGNVVKLYGIDAANSMLSAAPYVRFVEVEPTHKHSFSDKWVTDSGYHWHECECTEKTDIEAHTAGAWKTVTQVTATTDGLKEKYCITCGITMDSKVIPAYGEGGTPPVDPDPTPEKLGLRGDVNRNGKLDARDYLLLKRAFFKTYKLDEVATLLGDVNNNGKIDARDYLLLKRAFFKTYNIPADIQYVYSE